MPMVPGSNLGGGGVFFLILHKYLLSKVRGSNPGRDISFFLLKSLFFLLQLIQYSQIFTRFWLINWYVHKSHSIWLSFKCGYLIGPRSTVLAIYARLKTLFDLLYACTRYFLPNWSDFYPKSSSPIEWAHCAFSRLLSYRDYKMFFFYFCKSPVNKLRKVRSVSATKLSVKRIFCLEIG